MYLSGLRHKRRPLGWLSPALLIAALALGSETGKVANAQEPTTQFILRASADKVEAIAARYGLTIIRADEHEHGVYLVSGPAPNSGGSRSALSRSASEAEQDLVETLQNDPEVGHFEPNALVVTPEVPAGIDLNHSTVEILDSLNNRTIIDYFGRQAWHGYTNQPAASAIRLAESHATAATGAGIVAIIDTGIDPTHPLLQGSLVPGYDFVNDVAGSASEWNDLDHSTVEILDHSTVEILDSAIAPVPLNPSTIAILSSTAPLDPTLLPAAFGHGTMVAGIVHLVAPTAQIMPLKAFHADGTSRAYDIVRAIYYAVDHGARVINMSFSATVSSPEIARAINYATDRGVICVASAGNLGQEVVVYPGGFRNVLGVASTNSATPPVRSSFTNFGDALVSLAAPGEGVITTYPGGGYAGTWGTSFSTPLVAGGAALLVQIDPTVNYQKANEQFAKAVAMTAGMGKGRLNLFEAVRTLADVTAPTVSVLTPSGGGVVSGEVLLSASASDNVAVTSVKFLLDSSPFGVEDTAAPYEQSWSTTSAPNGHHVLTAIARDAAGNTTSHTTSVMLANDFEAPTVSLTGPAAGAIVGGNVTLTATAADDIAVVGVQFKLDGTAIGGEDVDAPYEMSWATDPVSDGLHALTAVARDAAGKETVSTINVTVTHDVTAPTVTVTSPGDGTTIAGAVTVTAAAADDVGVVSVQLLMDGAPFGSPITAAPYETTWSTAAGANGTHTWSAVARDAAGHVTTASAVSVTVRNDLSAPTVGLSSPAAGATLDGIVSVTAAAADDIGVVSVQFLLDGSPLGAAVVAEPYQVEWSTTAAGNGAHTLTAVAIDAVGRETTAAAVIVNVINDAAAPTVALTSPSAGTTIDGTVVVTATAVDDVGVIGVQFLLDGQPLGAVDTEPPYAFAWATTTVPNGAHTVTAVAQDGAGHAATAAVVGVTVENDLEPPTVAVTAPLAGTTVSGLVTLTVAASDDVRVTGVQFQVDGETFGAEDLAAPYELPWSTTTVNNGAHLIAAVARDASGRQTAHSVSVTVLNDLAAPTVALTSPTAGTTVGGTVPVSASASDDLEVISVQFLVNDTPLGEADTAAPYVVQWPTATAVNGAHTLSAVARDAAGHETTTTVSVAVLNDTAAPTVAITNPGAASTVSGLVTVTATASDDVGVASVQFLVDGAALGAADTAAPYEAAWPTDAASNGARTLTAVARDAAGRETIGTLSVSVLNDAAAPTVAVTGPANGATLGGTVTVTATASDDIAVTSVQFLVDGAALGAADTSEPYAVAWPTDGATNGAHTLTAVARDAAGHESTSAIGVAVLNDTAAPTVSVTSPTNGTTVGATVTVTATASDDVGVTSVQFLVDGAALGEADTAAPYAVEWPTGGLPNGAHTLAAVARDAAGRETTTTTINVAVLNDTAAPTVAVTSPTTGSTVGATVTVTATASDDVGVTSVQFLVDGAALGEADTAAPYTVEWPTGGLPNGSHTLAAVARDAAGHETTTTAISVAVLNDTAAPTVAVTSPTTGSTVGATVTVTATASDDVGVTSVQFLVDGAALGEADTTAPYAVEWPTGGLPNGAHTLAAVARDAAGHETTTTTISVAVLNDAAAPTVAIVSPTNGNTLSGTVTVTASAADDVGVTSVQFLVNGVALGDPDTAPPYAIAWPTDGLPNGAHTLLAVARDAAGHESTSTISVAVLNDTVAPTVAVTSPTNGAIVGLTVLLTATASDDVGVTSVQFLIDGNPLGTADTTAPYQAEWLTAGLPTSAYTVTAVARDAAGHESTSTISVATPR